MALSTMLALLAMIASVALAFFVLSETQWRTRTLARDLEDARRLTARRGRDAYLGGLLSTVCNLLPLGVVVVGPDGDVVLCNPSAATLLGRDVDAPPTALSDLTPYLEVLTTVRQALHQRRTTAGVVSPASGRFVEVTAQPIDQGGALLVLHDVSELRLLRTVRRDFVANVSHELRTPLAAIRLLVDTLEAGALDEADVAPGFVHRIGVEADQLIQMVTELLELSRIESGQLPIKREPVAMGEVIAHVVERLMVVAQDKEIAVDSEVPPALPPALADRDQVSTVLLNLLFNAVKFTPRGGTVTISAQAHDGHLTIAMADTGIGIPREDLTRIFERFYKSDKARARSGGGTGLGLPIAKHIVESHGGSIWADSAEGEGSTFTFTLPTVS
jgi:two-component system phosphate regulon sensor histidine kinase PhoR